MKYQGDYLEESDNLTEYDYKFLEGDKEFWPSCGAALSIVSDWCRGKGYGDFGEPTERGQKAMRGYIENND